ncbi:MAG: hypothetical protein ACK53Y_06460 [bacterium]|jgi:hypothetical protein
MVTLGSWLGILTGYNEWKLRAILDDAEMTAHSKMKKMLIVGSMAMVHLKKRFDEQQQRLALP